MNKKNIGFRGLDILEVIAKDVKRDIVSVHADGPGYNDHSGDDDHNKSA